MGSLSLRKFIFPGSLEFWTHRGIEKAGCRCSIAFLPLVWRRIGKLPLEFPESAIRITNFGENKIGNFLGWKALQPPRWINPIEPLPPALVNDVSQISTILQPSSTTTVADDPDYEIVDEEDQDDEWVKLTDIDIRIETPSCGLAWSHNSVCAWKNQWSHTWREGGTMWMGSSARRNEETRSRLRSLEVCIIARSCTLALLV